MQCVSAINEWNNFDPKVSLSLSSTFSYFVLILFCVCLLPKEMCYMWIPICTCIYQILDYKENWASKNWCFWTVVLEKTRESPLDYKEIRPVNPKGNQSWIFIGRTDAEALILQPPDEKNWPIGKDPDALKDWMQEKGITEDEMVGWHHWLDGHEFEYALGVGDG